MRKILGSLFAIAMIAMSMVACKTINSEPIEVIRISTHQILGPWPGDWSGGQYSGDAELTITFVNAYSVHGTLIIMNTPIGTKTLSMRGNVAGKDLVFGDLKLSLSRGDDGTTLYLNGAYNARGEITNYRFTRKGGT
ncbi:MAG: hypothetical protein Q8R36_00725 [bacterium]|nr:hypothetical protein [bacterium]